MATGQKSLQEEGIAVPTREFVSRMQSCQIREGVPAAARRLVLHSNAVGPLCAPECVSKIRH